MSEKPRYRVRAGVQTADAYVNPATRTGRGQQNLASQGGYAFSYWTRNRIQLEAAYRGSWIIGNAVDCVADDMTRAGIDILGLSDTGEDATLQAEISRLGIWSAVNDVIKWARLYGGALGIIMIDGQDPKTPLNIDAIGKDQFKGIYAIDRWLTVPNYTDLITDFGPDVGLPKYYEIVPGDWPFSGQTIHHSRIIRADGIRLPIYQRQYENGWGMSIVERIFDVLTAFDSATVGAAQLVYKAHLRVMKVVGYKQVMGGMNDAAKRGIMAQIDNIRQFQSNEGMSVIDSEDELRADTYTFAGLNDILMQFAQQIAGATQIPMTRLMGQSPAGFSTGDSDIRQYQEGIAQRQERHRPVVHNLIRMIYQSTFGKPAPDTLTFRFGSLWGMNDEQKANIAATRTNAVNAAFTDGLVDRATALRELKAGAEIDGAWNTITEEMIEGAEDEPPGIDENVINPEQPGQQPDAENLTEAPTETRNGET